MSKHIGVQLIAPDGFGPLEAGRTYHYLGSGASSSRVLLLHFIQRNMVVTKGGQQARRWTPWPVPVLLGLQRGHFEEGLTTRRIVEAETQHALPPWLRPLEGRNLQRDDLKPRDTRKRSHRERVERIVDLLQPLVEKLDVVLCAPDPDKLVNAHARNCRPPQNETRMRVWFYTYIAFGRNLWSLHYPIHRIGHWDRETRLKVKTGRPSLARGSQQGHSFCDPKLIGEIYRGYRKFSGLGQRMSWIYQQTMVKIFGCKVAVDEQRQKYFYHLEGKPFPTLRQFVYRVLDHFGVDAVRLTLYGAARTRNRLRPSEGKFTESVGHLMERVEADAYWVDEVARGYLDESYLPALCVVRIRCVASGMFVGIGFSLGAETGEAYRMALFCAAIGKVKFCALFGFAIEAHEWPSIGLPTHAITDRGAGSTAKGRASDSAHQPVIIEIAPAWAGQSKAIIEASNPRAVHVEGQPTFTPTSMTISELAVREITRTVRDNDAMDVCERLTPAMIAEGVKQTPLGLWDYLDQRARNCAVSMHFDDAVRAFLTPVDLPLRCDGVYFKEIRCDSPALRDSGLMDRVATSQSTQVAGYVLSACARHLWVETAAGLVEVDAMKALRDGDRMLWLSVAELQQISVLRAQGRSLARVHREAVGADLRNRFEETTGHAFDVRTRQPGRAKRGSTEARREASEAKEYLRPRTARGRKA